MKGLALRNLVRNRARTALALLGLATLTAGVLVLVGLVLGARRELVGSLDAAPGVLVTRAAAFNVFASTVPASLEAKLEKVPGVSAVLPEVWVPGDRILVGVDLAKNARLRGGGMFASSIVAGHQPRDARSALVARVPVGHSIPIFGHELVVSGTFKTRSPIFDEMVIADESVVRAIAQVASSSVSCFFLEVAPGEDPDLVAKRVRAVLPRRVTAESIASWGGGMNRIVAGLDRGLVAISVLAGAIGGLGVVNVMLMSVRERRREIGVLRATGWTRGEVFRLIVIESSALGLASAVLGVSGGAFAARQLARVLPVEPLIPVTAALACGLAALALAVLGGIYPALRAARLDPIAAIRS